MRRYDERENVISGKKAKPRSFLRRRAPRLGGWAGKLSFILFCISSAALAAPRFDHYLLKGPGQCQELISRDLDQDGRVDLLATCAAGTYPNYSRSLALFRQRADGSFPPAPDQVLALDRQAALVDVGEVLPDPGLELLLLGPDGIRVAVINQGRYQELKPLLSYPTFAALADPIWVPVWDFARDWDGDQADEILVPSFASFALYQSPAGPAQELKLGVRPSLQPTFRPGTVLEAKFTLWEVSPGDFDGDGKTDIIAFQSDSILVFKQKENGQFETQADPRLNLNLWDERARQEREIRPLTQAIAPDYYILTSDFNGDRRADFLALTLTGGIMGLDSETRIYFGGDPGRLRGRPTQTFRIKDAGAGPFLKDLDRDGQQELLLSYAAMSVSNAAKTVLSGKADVVSECYRLGPDGRYALKPAFVYKSSVKMNLRTVTAEGSLPMFLGDFDGDGQVDIFQGISKDEAVIVLARPGGYDHPPELKLACPIPVQLVDNPRVQDFDGDGLADFALVYPRRPEHAQSIHVFMNRGGWH